MVRRSLILALAFATAMANPVFAEDADKGKPDFHQGGHFAEIKEKLKLSEEQEKQMKEIRKGGSMWEKQKEVFAEKDKLRDLIKKKDSSEAEIFALVEKVNKMQAEANTSRVKNILAFKKILSPEQFTILSDHMEEKRAAFREGMKERFKDRFQGKEKPEN